MLKYDVTIGVIGEDIILEDGLTHHDYLGFVGERWTLGGVLSRLTGPALTIFRESDIDYLNQNDTLAEFWYKDGMLNNKYGSGVSAYLARDPEYLYEERRDYEDGLLHNNFSAAVRNQFESRYFLRGVEFSKEDFEKQRGNFPSPQPPPRPL